ncbi:MAG TPA: hypothetical protein VNQ33_12060 [Acidimicrobiales bacterium]|nr:hypothetical protein [Acidimicrobiales bacterium]
MSGVHPAAKLAGFAVILVASFGAAFGAGRLVDGPDDRPARPTATTSTSVVATTTTDHGAHP